MELLEFSVVNPDCTEIEYDVEIHKYDNELGERGLMIWTFPF